MSPSTPSPVFRRATPPAAKAPIPAGQTNTAAYGAGGTLRLNKRMAELGLASRREADDWIAKGWVKVNGRVAEMGMQVAPDVRIEIDKQATGAQAKQVTVLINKPLGLVSGQAEDGHQPAITLVQPQNRWAEDNARFFFHPSQLKSLVPAGRLDIDSTGLLVLTQDGRVARQLIGEDTSMEKEYLVRVIYTGVANAAAATAASATHAAAPGAAARMAKAAQAAKQSAPGQITQLSRIDDDDPISQDVQSVFPAEKLALLRHGLSLDGQALKHAKVEWQNPEQLRFVLHEGKKRQIRRMCEQVGLKVVGLKRVRIGHVMLGNLPVGQWRYLQPHEKF
ncbi:pseudouridine synthase [Rhodoferax sp.]|uniref:pseudouridine synthase n=1 Tax=Rhodoferax sp. TaxID=50421 RepID=UPI002613537B|nr:pseudouridine synthase [Rhodoferax sp.]MDD2809111.1 pseudouridine synthase [Rhodoferax sp.]MDD4942196.1 pseudouridine synthase [Rhodoferax sp.]MDD5480633.1 pseudouridine synthase [Rhodoferax sp.]